MIGMVQLAMNYRGCNTRNYFFMGFLARGLGSAIVNHNLRFVRQKRNRSHTTIFLEQQADTSAFNTLKNFVAAYRYLYRSNQPQSFMTVVVIFNSYFLFPDLGKGMHEVRESKQ